MNVAVIFDQKLFAGGGYQQSLNALKLIQKNEINNFNFIFYTTIFKNKRILNEENIHLNYLKFSFILRILCKLRLNPRFQFFKILIDFIFPFSLLELELNYKNIDLVYFVSPSNLVIDLKNINYVFTVWDLCHLSHPEFPEVRQKNQFEIRENLFNSVLNKSFRIIVDSKYTKKQIVSKYRIDKRRIKIIPFEPNSNLEKNIKPYFQDSLIEKQINKFSHFLLYPAQYWSHKNHIYIIKAIKILSKKTNFNIGVVFTGANKGNLDYLRIFARKNKIEEKIIFLKFVTDSDLTNLYKKCLFVVMTSYFGPCNLPPLEGFKFGKPVLYPKINSFINEFKDSPVYIDLKDPNSMVNEVIKLFEDKTYCNLHIQKGFKYLEKRKIYSSKDILNEIFYSFYKIKQCWK